MNHEEKPTTIEFIDTKTQGRSLLLLILYHPTATGITTKILVGEKKRMLPH
jgi:hypothetical protein